MKTLHKKIGLIALLITGISVIGFLYSCDKDKEKEEVTNQKQKISELQKSDIDNYQTPANVDYSVKLESDFIYSKMYGNVGSYEKYWRYINLDQNIDFFAQGEIIESSSDGKTKGNFNEDLVLEKIDATSAVLKGSDLTKEIIFKNIVSKEHQILFDIFIDGEYLCNAELFFPELSFDNFTDLLPLNISQEKLNQTKAAQFLAPLYQAITAVAVAIELTKILFTPAPVQPQPRCTGADYSVAISNCALSGKCYTLDLTKCEFSCHACK